MKRLVYQQDEAIKQFQNVSSETVTVCNQLLTAFKSKHNHFSQPIDEKFAFDLITSPLQTFDGLLRSNSPLKKIGNKEQDIKVLSTLCGIDREGFIMDFKVVMPGSKNQYNRQGTTSVFSLTGKYHALVSWENDQFVLNERALSEACEQLRVYAETPEQLAELEYWEHLCNVLNVHAARIKLDTIESHQIAQRLKIEYQDKRFVPKYKALSVSIKEMASA